MKPRATLKKGLLRKRLLPERGSHVKSSGSKLVTEAVRDKPNAQAQRRRPSGGHAGSGVRGASSMGDTEAAFAGAQC